MGKYYRNKQGISFLLVLLFFLMNLTSFAQLARVKRMIKLPNEVNETSGLEYVDSLGYLIHNDSFNEPFIYLIDDKGKIQHQCKLYGVEAFDLEDIHYSNDTIFVADAGNNFNERKQLFIYFFPINDFLKNDSLIPNIIAFNYADQDSFPPPPEQMNFDSESLIKVNNDLIIFSKNRGTSTFTKAYRLPVMEGYYSIEAFDSFDTGGWIAAADISHDYKKMVLISYDYLWVFFDFDIDKPFSGKSHFVKIPFSQKESVLFKDENILIADEKNIIDGYIYKLKLKKAMKDRKVRPAYDYLFSRPCIKWIGSRLRGQ